MFVSIRLSWHMKCLGFCTCKVGPRTQMFLCSGGGRLSVIGTKCIEWLTVRQESHEAQEHGFDVCRFVPTRVTKRRAAFLCVCAYRLRHISYDQTPFSLTLTNLWYEAMEMWVYVCEAALACTAIRAERQISSGCCSEDSSILEKEKKKRERERERGWMKWGKWEAKRMKGGSVKNPSGVLACVVSPAHKAERTY